MPIKLLGVVSPKVTISFTMYSKREGTSGISGQLYESKLISLLYFRAVHDKRIVDFQIATNMDNIGAFDDICFKATVEGFDKPILVFIQAKHRENENQTLKNDLGTYFDSYKKIRHIFESNKNDFLNGGFDETECLFVIYTTARDEYSNVSNVNSDLYSYLDSLIKTGGTVKQPYAYEDNIQFLTKMDVEDQITSLGNRIAKLIMGEGNTQLMLTDELILRYHVILAQKVFNVSEIKPGGQRIASIRPELFDTNEEYIVLFKDTLFKEILKTRKIHLPDVENLLSEFLAKPTDATLLSKLIGTVISYDNGYLDFVKKSTKDFRQRLNQVFVSRSTVNQAVALAANEMLSSREFKVPPAFGNKDLILSGNDAKKEKRVKHLTSKIIDLIDLENLDSKSCKKVTIDDSVENGLLQLNGGIGSTIGNIFVLDEDTKLMKITDNCDSLGDNAKILYKKLNKECQNLHEYKFCFKIDKFPKLLFDCSEYEENVARDFLTKLLFYSNQADENHVEIILKREIECYQLGRPNYFKPETDAIFSKYHDAIQKWWKEPKKARYLTRKPDLFQDSINNIIKDPLMRSLNLTFMTKMKQCSYLFSEDAVRSLKLQEQHSNTFIITKNCVLTVLKVIQYFKDKEHVILDLEDIINLPEDDRKALHTELTNMNHQKALIFVFDQQIHNTRIENNILEIVKAVKEKPTIVITNDLLVEILKKSFSRVDFIIRDERSRLIDMTEEFQKSIVEDARVIFQGIEVRLNSIVDDESMACVTEVVLSKLINEETIVVGKLTVNRNYDEIKHLYMDRRLMKTGDCVGIVVKTLVDIEKHVVLVTAEPGMGKSILLSHLSLETKKYHPELWIVRINLLEHCRQFSKWKAAAAVIDTLETLKFICQIIIREKLGKESDVDIVLEEENDVVYLKHCMGDQWIVFELKVFLHLYNKRKVILLFDGFDEICPHYQNEVINCLKSASNHPRKQRVWITSRSFNEVKTILQQEFGLSYEICYLIYTETEKYLETFFEYNLRLLDLTRPQLENVENFFKYMSTGATVKGFANVSPERPLHRVYNSATRYLLNEITFTPIRIQNLTEKDLRTIKDFNLLALRDENKNTSCGNPLYLFLAAYFFVNNIKNINRDLMGWKEIMFLETNAFAYYEWFLKTKIIERYEVKNKMDIYNPDIMDAYEKDLADSILRYKKLAAYAIFNFYNLNLFSTRDLTEIKDMIKLIEKGREKTGLIYGVANEIPIFIHMTFTEHFAVEYVCDCLKNEIDRENRIFWIEFIIHVMFSEYYSLSVRKTFDYKMDHDEILISIFEQHSEETFNSIMIQIFNSDLLRRLGEKNPLVMVDENICVLSNIECERVNIFTNLLSKTVSKHLTDKSKLNQFLEIVNETKLLPIAVTNSSIKFPLMLFGFINKIDKPKLKPLLFQNFSYLSDSINYDEISEADLLKLIQEGLLEELSKGGGTTITAEQKHFFHLFSHITSLDFSG